MRLLPTTLFLIVWALPAAWAEPAAYALQLEKSSVTFTYLLNGQPMRGTMPITRADLILDWRRLENAQVEVALNAQQARAGMGIATSAMRGASVLNVARYPQIRYHSTGVRRTRQGARIDGLVTLRGVTRPMPLKARIYRQQGTPENDLSRLSILLTGEIARAAFGAGGFSDVVGDRIKLRILARIRRLD